MDDVWKNFDYTGECLACKREILFCFCAARDAFDAARDAEQASRKRYVECLEAKFRLASAASSASLEEVAAVQERADRFQEELGKRRAQSNKARAAFERARG